MTAYVVLLPKVEGEMYSRFMGFNYYKQEYFATDRENEAEKFKTEREAAVFVSKTSFSGIYHIAELTWEY